MTEPLIPISNPRLTRIPLPKGTKQGPNGFSRLVILNTLGLTVFFILVILFVLLFSWMPILSTEKTFFEEANQLVSREWQKKLEKSAETVGSAKHNLKPKQQQNTFTVTEVFLILSPLAQKKQLNFYRDDIFVISSKIGTEGLGEPKKVGYTLTMMLPILGLTSLPLAVTRFLVLK